MSDVQAFIFDMDDTIARTGPIWRQAELALLDAIGGKWSPELASHYKGMNALDVASTAHRLLKPSLTIEACQRIMRDALIGEFRKHPIEAMPAAVECVRRMRKLGKMALASGSPLAGIHEVLNQLHLFDQFDVIVSSESVAHGKPHPDVFLAAAEQLEVGPSDCLVFEDSVVGAQAAFAAGMRCFVVSTFSPPEAFNGLCELHRSWADVTDAHVASV
jgi:HAD superfamily hydrolase (TIGR01509 family)